jgi:hypothetical protein
LFPRDEVNIDEPGAPVRESFREFSGRCRPLAEFVLEAGRGIGARKHSVGVDEVPVAEHGRHLEPQDAIFERADRAGRSEEVIEERPLHPVLVDEEEQLVQLRVPDRAAVVG